MADDEITVSVYVGKKMDVSAIHSFIHSHTQRLAEHAGFIFESTFAA